MSLAGADFERGSGLRNFEVVEAPRLSVVADAGLGMQRGWQEQQGGDGEQAERLGWAAHGADLRGRGARLWDVAEQKSLPPGAGRRLGNAGKGLDLAGVLEEFAAGEEGLELVARFLELLAAAFLAV